jgi:snurportin-1
MDVEPPVFTFGGVQGAHPVTVTIESDGLLLYVAEANYESGTSPLSSWIPVVTYDDDKGESQLCPGPSGLEVKQTREQSKLDGPLAVFERYVAVEFSSATN